MEENTRVLGLELKHENTEVSTADDYEGKEIQKRQLLLENDTNKNPSLQSLSNDEASSDKLAAEINGEVSEKTTKSCAKLQNDHDILEDLSETRIGCPAKTTTLDNNCSEDKENNTKPQVLDNKEEQLKLDQKNDSNSGITEHENNTQDFDAEILKRAQEEGCVNVVFPGTVTQDGCCRFVSEILKCVLYQRQQLPMTYDQLVYSQKKTAGINAGKHKKGQHVLLDIISHTLICAIILQDKETVRRRPVQTADMDLRKCQQTLQDLEELLQHLEVLFSLSRVPRVLLLMGGTLVLPRELYEINMEALVLASGDKSLRVSSCLRQLFRTLFVADLLSDTKPVRLMPTTVLVLAHRDCGVAWFRPKQQFKVPTRVKSKVMALSTNLSSCEDLKRMSWTGMIISGFRHQ
ncbi:hypothetical protein WMY93_018206 [Mugilogobius chulae]|uniref:MAD2L1-binding protein n=1 Tax=Mugilogobius chulae TaxID=88201 RepID=A0AAW0NN25_9GOBI